MIVNVTLDSKIPNLLQQLEASIRAEQERKAKEILRDAQADCPVDTGKLRDSGYEKTTSNGSTIQSEVGFTAEYAPYIEARKSFLYKNYVQHEEDIVHAIAEAIKRI